MTPHIDLSDWLLSHASNGSFEAWDSLEAWKLAFDTQKAHLKTPIARAAVGGYLADRLAYAFAGGYQCALRQLDPTLPEYEFAALCISEADGGHPRNIKSTLIQTGDDWVLHGQKQFVTCAEESQWLLIAATTGVDAADRNRLRVVKLSRQSPGLRILPMPPLGFVPEISHGIVRLDGVKVKTAQFLDGDGYLGYIKPFRTIEDLHIFAAVLGYVFRVGAQFNWPSDIQAETLSLLVTACALANRPPLSQDVHIALGGLLRRVMRFFSSLDMHWQQTDKHVQQRWERDNRLLTIASSVREQRFKTAWRHYGVDEAR